MLYQMTRKRRTGSCNLAVVERRRDDRPCCCQELELEARLSVEEYRRIYHLRFEEGRLAQVFAVVFESTSGNQRTQPKEQLLSTNARYIVSALDTEYQSASQMPNWTDCAEWI